MGCSDAFMTLCACPYVGHYQAGHFVVWYLMSSTTHLMCIKCGDSAYLLTRAARLRTIYPPRRGLDPCISPLIGDVLNALCSPYKFSPHNSLSVSPAQHKTGAGRTVIYQFHFSPAALMLWFHVTPRVLCFDMMSLELYTPSIMTP